jgi:hypothetical protein
MPLHGAASNLALVTFFLADVFEANNLFAFGHEAKFHRELAL